MKKTIFAVMLSCVTLMAVAGTNTWTSLGPEGGRVEKIVFSPAAGTVFALTMNGVYRSVNGGSSWQLVPTDVLSTPQSLAIDPVDPQRVYVTIPATPTFYRSTDGGASFQPVTVLPAGLMAGPVATAHDGQTVYVAGGGARVFRSTDHGQTWTERTAVSTDSFAYVYRLLVDPTSASTAYAVAQISSSQMSVVRTQDGGQSWQVLYTGYTLEIAASPNAPGYLWAVRDNLLTRSSDRGATWTTLLSDIGLNSVAVDASDANIVYAGTAYGAIHRTSNGGGIWTIATGTHYAADLRTLALDPANNSHVLAGGIGGLYGSSNAGASWTKQQTGMQAAWIDHLSRDPVSGRLYMNASSDGIYYLDAGATTAQPVDNLELRQLESGNPSQPAARIYITSMFFQSGSLLASISKGLARSVDGGTSWALQPILPGSGSQQIFALAGSQATPPTLLAGSHSVVMRSINSGATWSAGGTGLPTPIELYDLQMALSDSHRAYALVTQSPNIGPGSRLGVYRSMDGGVSWSASGGDPATAPTRLLAVDPLVPDTLYGATDSALFRSTNGGATWTAVNLGATGNGYISAMAIDPQNPQVLYVVGSRVLRTLDGGVTWDVLRSGDTKPNWSASAALLDPARPGALLVATQSRGLQEFTTAPDLRLTGSGPSGATGLGVPVVYNLQLSNQGPFGTTGAVVHLRWPASASNVTVAASGATCTSTATSANCRYAVFRNADSASLTVTVGTATAGTLQLDASVDSDLPDANMPNNLAVLPAQVAPRAELSVTVAGTASVQEAGAVNYTVTAHNNGPNPATSPTLTIQLASGVTAGVVTTTAGSCSTSSSLVTCALGDLPVNGTVTVTIAATANTAGTQTSSAQLTSVTADSVGADNTATVVTTVTSPPPPPSGGGGSGGGGSGGGSSGGGGGGAASWLDLLALLLMTASAARSAHLRAAATRIFDGAH